MRRLLINCCIFINYLQLVLGQEATLYDDINYRGSSTRVPIGMCRNVFDFNDKTSSVRTNEKCIRLWEHGDCTGRRVDVSPPGHDNLVNLKFNDFLSSVSDCRYGGYSDTVAITVDTSEAPDLYDHGQKAKKLMEDWFPFMQNLLTTTAYKPVTQIYVKFDKENKGIYAAGNEIHVYADHLRNNPNDWGVFIHEMTHVIHQPGGGCPGWVVEGMAEWTRRWFYEPKTSRKPEKGRKFDTPYMGDWLLVYLNTVVGKPLIYSINKACQEGSWYDDFLKDISGKSTDEWWDIMINDDSYPWKR